MIQLEARHKNTPLISNTLACTNTASVNLTFIKYFAHYDCTINSWGHT